MEIKVNLPNPYEMSPEQFFAQMRISLKAAEKTYQEANKNLTEEQIEEKEIWLMFNLPKMEDDEKNCEKLDAIDPNYEDRQFIAISINTS